MGKEKYAAVYEINMLRCIFCGDCEEACPKEAIFLTDRKVDSFYTRNKLIYGKDILVESRQNPIDLSKRQTSDVKDFKKHKEYQHNQTHDNNTKQKLGSH